MFVAACVGAFVTRGWGHEGRFSIHLYGAGSALCVWALATFAGLVSSENRIAAGSPQRVDTTSGLLRP
jgi:hypothetical protein